MKLTDEVYLVGGGKFGFDLSHELDSHVYVVKSGDELVLIDTGFDAPDEILANIKNDGLDAANISRIFITHYHADHTGALARMKRTLGVPVITAAEAAPTIRAGDADQIGLTWAQRFEFYPPAFTWEACDVDIEMNDGDVFDVGGLQAGSHRYTRPLHGALLPAAARRRSGLPVQQRSRLRGGIHHPAKRG